MIKMKTKALAALLSCVTISGAYAATPQTSGVAYTIAHQVNIRNEAGNKGAIVAQLPIGADVEIGEVISRENRRWAMIFVRHPWNSTVPVSEGWIDISLLDTEKPNAKNLLAAAKNAGNPQLQRLLAERALALDPQSDEISAYIQSLIDADPAGTRRLQTILSDFAKRQPVSDEPVKRIYEYYSGVLTLFAEVQDQKITMITGKSPVAPEYFRENRYYRSYSGNRPTGLVRTEMRINQSLLTFVQPVLARYFPDPGLQFPEGVNSAEIHTLVTNYPLAKERPVRAITAQDKAVLKTLTLQWIQQQPKAERSNMMKLLSNQPISQHQDVRIKWFAGNLNKNGQIFLIGQWVFSSPSDVHYNNDPFYMSLVMIAEQQTDGSFKLARGSGNLYCEVDSTVDLTDDGTDEIYLECPQMEDASNYKILQRGKTGWEWIAEKSR